MANDLANRMGVQPQNFLTNYPLNYAPPLSQVAPNIPSSDNGILASLYSRLFGPDVLRAPFNQTYPSSQDVYYAQAYDQTYGTPMAGFTVSGAKMRQPDWSSDIQGRTPREIISRVAGVPPSEISPTAQEEIIKNWLGAQKSAVAALGYDPRAIARTQNNGEEPGVEGITGHRLSPNANEIWYNSKRPDAAIHEAFHRGIGLLSNAGALPSGIDPDSENLVRMLMLRNFGDIELLGDNGYGDQQVQSAKYTLQETPWTTNRMLDKLEKAAQDYIAKKTPRGPR